MKVFEVDFNGTCAGNWKLYISSTDEDIVYDYIEKEYNHMLCSGCFPNIEEIIDEDKLKEIEIDEELS